MPVISLLNAIWNWCVVHTCPPTEENSNNDFSKSVAFWRKKIILKYFFSWLFKSKKVMILQLGQHFKKHMFKIQGNNCMSVGEKGFLMNFLDNLPDLVIFLMII